MDIELFYTDHGRKDDPTPMVLLHGNGGNSSAFFYVVDHFTKDRRVITVDSRGHGRTPKGTAPFTLAQFAEDLREFLDMMKLKKVILIGYSDGGNIAMIFTLKYPEYVAGMIVASVRESFASEIAARRNAMDSAGKNAQEMIDELSLEYNRARQGAITQEITEIVAGSGAQ